MAMKRKRNRSEEEVNNRKIETRSMSRKNNLANQKVGDKKNSVFLPLDLIIVIFANLPLKSIAKFLCLSKLWRSIIGGKYFIDLFMTRSLTRPSFLFTHPHLTMDNKFFHSSSHESPSSLHHNGACTTLSHDYVMPTPVRGLICCRHGQKMRVCNPSTGQVVRLLNFKTGRIGITSFLGYDPVGDVYKVLCMTRDFKVRAPVVSSQHRVVSLGPPGTSRKQKWRDIECEELPHVPATNGLCVDGVVYYGAWTNSHRQGSMIVCFDVRQEVFRRLKSPEDVEIKHHRFELLRYHGKLALVDQSYGGRVDMWVLVDVEKQEWSKDCVVVPCWLELVGLRSFRFLGTIGTGECVFVPHSLPDPYPFFVVIYDRKKGEGRRVVIPRIGVNLSREAMDPDKVMTVFLDHVESLMLL
ncbi:unnamed protein product [Microthlaspi erraticum]|uniref:F-box domain-containing protein n=1 Tax=Microthlaspi erraticum TaxID=1685480 RepID=A0A6D2JJ74_9BRAS|nr:unnamed protein product [Microthlaspi erraticum]